MPQALPVACRADGVCGQHPLGKSSPSPLLYIHPGTKCPGVTFGRGIRDYFVRQATALLKFAKETTNPQLAAVLIEKAAALKSQVDEPSRRPDLRPSAPDIEIEPET